MDMNLNLEEIIVSMIANAGDSRSSAIEAINFAKEGDFSKAKESLDHSQETLEKAHKAHTRLLAHESNEGLDISLLVVHAATHLSIAEVSRHFAEELVTLHESIEK